MLLLTCRKQERLKINDLNCDKSQKKDNKMISLLSKKNEDKMFKISTVGDKTKWQGEYHTSIKLKAGDSFVK